MVKGIRVAALFFLDAILINVSYILAFLLRFEFYIDSPVFLSFFSVYTSHILQVTLIKLAVLVAVGLYNSLWKYAGTQEFVKIVAAAFVGTGAVGIYLLLIQQGFPRSVYIMDFVMNILLIGGVRFSYRFFRGMRGTMPTFSAPKQAKRTMVIGAGEAGATIIKEMRNHSSLNATPIVVVDDNKDKLGKRISGVKIAGTRKEITKLTRRYKIEEIIIAIPSANKKDIQEIMNECNKTNCKIKILPALYELIGGQVSISKLRDVDIEDLLGRDAIQVDLKEISDYLKSKIVLVTGAGGSIGSELCRQIAKFLPRKIIALDIYENGVFAIQNELKRNDPDLEVEVVIASVTDINRMTEAFEKYCPHVVFHAAAHKHVPLMEINPKEAVVNNIFGTKLTAELAEKYAVEKFVLISTDKAVNPCNVMGTTKRVAEMIIQTKSKTSTTLYSAVRFGNVLGSNGSVVPIFRNQIEEGGPVTVTHPDVTRYFMTIPEAVQLVIQAGAMANGGEIFVLDMGKPVRIMDLAENLIRLSGYKPYEEVQIKIIGLRMGEKLYEELLLDDEGIENTTHEKIYIGKPLELDGEEIEKRLAELASALSCTDDEVKQALETIVPTYLIRH